MYKLERRSWQAAGADPDSLAPGRGQLWRSYRYNRQRQLAELRDGLRGRIDYDYDPAGRLLRQNHAVDRAQERFAWDAAGNLLDNTDSKSRGLVEGNRLKVWQDIRFEYDAWGNVSCKRKGMHSNQRFSFGA
nr:hypothetical protein [Massilia forsythiae]